MRLFIFGAGAIGGYLAGELALVGHEVYAIVRGPLLAAIRGIHWFRPVLMRRSATLSAGTQHPSAWASKVLPRQ
jgi:nucleoside-diphosphate-sugar epimerase